MSWTIAVFWLVFRTPVESTNGRKTFTTDAQFFDPQYEVYHNRNFTSGFLIINTIDVCSSNYLVLTADRNFSIQRQLHFPSIATNIDAQVQPL